METADPRKEGMGKEPEHDDRARVENARDQHDDETTALGSEAEGQDDNDIVPALQEEHPAGPGAGYEEFVEEDANLRASQPDDVERQNISTGQNDVERERYSDDDDVERENI